MATSTLARDAGIKEEVFTAVTMLVFPAAIGYFTAFTVMVPAPKGSLQSMSVVASPSQLVSFTPAADTVAVKWADVMVSSTVPVPVKVSVVPVWILVGFNSVTVACLAPQSDHVTARLPASTVTIEDNRTMDGAMLEKKIDKIWWNL